MWPASRLAERLGIALPILQAPMASISTADMAAAVSAAGGLGAIGAALMTPAEAEAQILEVRRRTPRPFSINFFVHPEPRRDQALFERMRQRLEAYHHALGSTPPAPGEPAPPFGRPMLERLLALRPPVVSFHFGLPEPEAVAALRAAGIVVLSSATTVSEARMLEEGGVDAVIAQGVEAGGHRATFASRFEEGQIGTLALVPQIVRSVKLPVIAAGGIADGRGIAAALMLGADAAQLGTGFLGCPEAQIDPLYRRTLFEPRAASTRLTRLFTGRPARAIVTRFMEEMAAEEARAPEFPLQRSLTASLGKAGAAAGTPEFLAMWAGQSATAMRALPAAELLATLARETESALDEVIRGRVR